MSRKKTRGSEDITVKNEEETIKHFGSLMEFMDFAGAFLIMKDDVPQDKALNMEKNPK